nr:reverse transcriptase domain-containing protein [Tanacetum cinerariifolium]
MAKMFLGKYFPPSMVTKLRNEITNFCQRPYESLFKAWERYKLSIDRCPNHNMLPVTQIDTFYNMLTLRHRDTINADAGGTFMKRRPEECYDLIENMTIHHNDWDTSTQRSESSISITSSFDLEIVALKVEMAEINKNLMKVLQINQQVKAVTPSCETCGDPFLTMIVQPPLAKPRTYMLRELIKVQAPVHQPPIPQLQVVTTIEFTNYMKLNDAILKNMQTNMTSLTNSNLELKNMFGQFMKMNTASSSGSGTLLGNTVTYPKEDLKGITTRSGTAYQGSMNPTTSSFLPKVVERETEVTKDTVPPTNNGSTKDVQPPVVQTETLIPNSEPVIAPVSAPKPNQKPSIPYPSRLHDQKLRDKDNDQREKFFQIFRDLNFNISSADALILMPKFGPTIKTLLTNKDKLYEPARTPLNEHCSAILLKKLEEKLGTPTSFSSRAERALIDVYAGELTLRVNNEAVTFNLDQTLSYSANYNDMTANRIVSLKKLSRTKNMTTPSITSSTDSQMHNSIMTTGSRDRPPMLALGRYPQWRSRFLRYVDTRPNGEALRKCILSGPYKPTTVLVHAVKAIDNSPSVPKHTTDPLYQSSRSHRSSAPSPKPSIPTRSHTATRHKGKEIAKPITPPFKIAFEEDNDPKQAQRDKDMQKNLALIAKYFKKIYKPTNNNLRTSLNSKNKNVDTTPRFKNDNQSGQFGNQRMVNVVAARKNVGSKVVQQSRIQCFNCKEYGHFSKECRKPKRVKDSAYHKKKMLLCKQAEQAHYSYMAKIQEVHTADSGTDSEPVEQTKKAEFEKFKAFSDRTVDYEKLKRKLNEALGQLAHKDTIIREGLKTKAYELSVVKEKHDELMKHSLLTKSHYKGLVKQRTKVITDLKHREEHDIEKMLSMKKQLKFLNKIVYKRSQSIQIHMMAPKVSTYNGRPTFANPIYLKQAQSEIPCLYAYPYDQSTHANRLIPDREETLALERENRSKLNKDLVRPYDYATLNSVYEIFKPPTQEYETQLAHANKIRRKMWRKSFVKSKPNIYKNIKHSKDLFCAPTAQDMEILIQTSLMPLAIKTQSDSLKFIHELKQEMHADLKYIESLEKEIDELESDKAEFSNMYDVILQECVSKDVMCSYLQSLSHLDALAELQCMYLHKVKECDCLA